MNWEKYRKSKDSFYIPNNWIYIHYYEALNVLFRVENALRIFVYITLKDNFQNKWVDLSLSSDDGNESTISSISKKRIAQDNNFAYLGYSSLNPLLYLTSGELIRLVTSDAYWKYFKIYFQGSRDIMKNKLDEIGKIRNALAHFRPIHEGDVELIKQNADHTLTLIEHNLFQLIMCPDVVPSNTEEEWYIMLRTLIANNINLRFYQSNDEKWVKINIEYNSTIYESRYYREEQVYYKISRLNSNKLLHLFPSLTKYILLLYEDVSFNPFSPKDPKFNKLISIVISRKSLNSNYKEIKNELEKCMRLIEEEVELIKQDNLARGKIIDVINLEASLNEYDSDKYYWRIDRRKVLSTKVESDLPEFWGTIVISRNLISDTFIYPWMEVDVSSDNSLPF